MFLYTFVFCAFIYRLEAHYSILSNENRQYLVHVIKALNGDDSERDERERKEDDIDLNDDEKEEILQEIMRLMKKNYKTAVKGEGGTFNSIYDGNRLHFIKNPEVLDEYKNYLKAKLSSPINYNPSGDRSGYIKTDKDNLKNIKKAILRLDTDHSSEDETYKLDKIEDIEETRKDNSRKKMFKEKYDLDDNNDSLDERNNKYYKSNKRNENRFTKGDSNLKVDIDSDLNSVERINRRPFDNKSKRDRGKSKKINEMKSFDDFKEINNKPKSNIVYRKPLREKAVFSFGRTHIPYVGKRGVYDDK